MTLVQAYKRRRLAYGGDLYGETYLQDITPTLQESQKAQAKNIPTGVETSTDINQAAPVAGNETFGTGAAGREKGEGGLNGKNGWKNGAMGLIGGGASAVGALTDTFTNPDPMTGRKNIGSYIVKNAAKGAAVGSNAGWIGAIVGAVLGGIHGGIDGGKARREARTALATKVTSDRMRANDYAMKATAADPTLVSGYRNSSYFANGGAMTKLADDTTITAPLAAAYMNGGKAKALSSNNTEMKGRTHADGGIDIEGAGEVEDGETTMDNYVFSKKLGFADLHKPIAIAKGKIEKKPLTFERVNALKRLREREENLATLQEKYKQAHNLN